VMSTSTFQAISLGQNELKRRVTLTNEATEILKATCKAGQLHFDLYDPKAFLTIRPSNERWIAKLQGRRTSNEKGGRFCKLAFVQHLGFG
jgi:hypothetical protein